MKLVLVFSLALITALGFVNANAQEEAKSCGKVKRAQARGTVASSEEDKYDVKYVKLNLNLTNVSTALSGDVTTKAMVIAPSISTYVFELNPVYTIDSVLINGVISPFTTLGYIRTVSLSSPLNINTLFTAQVFYNGTLVAGTGGFFQGISNTVSPSWRNRVTYTISESYHANDWWPCKQSLKDKIDSTDTWLTVADSLKAGSNGRLVAITPIDANHNRYEWKERYPIDYYLISIAVAKYIDYSYYMHYTGSTDSMLIQNYIYDNPATLTRFKSVIDSTGMMVNYFSNLYGRYPFWKEKYGHCMAPISGGMEHETMTTIGFFDASVVAHELGHQWFGDNVTCATWADIFMNEGLASYTEDLFFDHFNGHPQMLLDIIDKQTNVKSFDTGTIFTSDTSTELRIFDSRLSYNKGACMLHMLRFITNNDNEFFQVYKTYQTQMKDSTGTIQDFMHTYENVVGSTVNGIAIDTFFKQWAYKEGYPLYALYWNQIDTDVYLKIVQTTVLPTSVAKFTLPAEIQFHSGLGDTTIRVVNDSSSQMYHFTWSKAVTTLTFDPNFWLVYGPNGIYHDPSLSVLGVDKSLVSIHPNPSKSNWIVEGLSANSTLTVTDITGKVFWQNKTSNAQNTIIPSDGFAPGIYFLQVKNNNQPSGVYKLVKE